jgi:hypothetical protein
MSESTIKAAREFYFDQVETRVRGVDEDAIHLMAQKVADEQTADLRNRLEAYEIFVNSVIEKTQSISRMRNDPVEIYGLADELEFDAQQALKELQEATK